MLLKQPKHKICDNCKKGFPQLYKNLTYEGKRMKVCKICAEKLEKKKLRQKRETAKAKKREKKAQITDRKLHLVFARLIKEIYPLVCHACSKPLQKGTMDCQACHFVERGKKIVTWDIRNVYPGCSYCNGFDQSHQYELGKKANVYWGEGTAEYLREIKTQIFKWSQYQKNQLYELFTDPPKADTLEEVRKLILEEYLKIMKE